MTLLDSICCTCVISSRRTAGLWRRYGWWSGGPSVSMVCWSSGVQPKSSSPWLIMSLNSWKRLSAAAAVLAIDVQGQAAGWVGWRQGVVAASQRGQRSLGYPWFVLCAGGGVQGGDYEWQPKPRIHW